MQFQRLNCAGSKSFVLHDDWQNKPPCRGELASVAIWRVHLSSTIVVVIPPIQMFIPLQGIRTGIQKSVRIRFSLSVLGHVKQVLVRLASWLSCTEFSVSRRKVVAKVSDTHLCCIRN
jgi:hypothetical protein